MTYTNIGTNLYARIASIESEERLHWYLGLRQAELELETNLKPALEDTFHKIEILTNQISQLKNQSVTNVESALEVIKLEREKSRLELLIPGTLAELKVVETKRDEIIEAHKSELENHSKDELDYLVARDCYLARCKRHLAAAQIRPLGFNDSEAQLLLTLPPEDQIAVMSQLQLHNAGAIALLANALGKVSPEQANQIVEIVTNEVTGILIAGSSD